MSSPSPVTVNLTVNGQSVSRDVDPRTLLVAFLRDDLGLTGAHVGCDTSQCGACVVHLDGRPVKACTVLAVQADGGAVTTIEGITPAEGLHPMQEAFRDHHGLQCGFCTPGMVMTALDLANRDGAPDDEAVKRQLEGNICRCTGYDPIVDSVKAGARAMRAASGAE